MQRWYYSVRGRFFLFTISLHIYFQWWESGKVKKRSAPCFPLFTKKRTGEQLHKIAQVQWWLSFRCCMLHFSFFFLLFSTRSHFVNSFLLHSLHSPSASLSLSLVVSQLNVFSLVHCMVAAHDDGLHTHTHFISTEMTIIYMWRHCLK